MFLLPDQSSLEAQQITQIANYMDQFIHGLMTTLGLYIFALAIGFVIGLVLSIVRLYGGPVSSRFATGYIEVIRGTPLVTQIFIFAYAPDAINTALEMAGLATFNTSWRIYIPDPFGGQSIFLSTRILMAAVCLALNSAAYQAEYLRGAMASISGGQLQAAKSMGMTRTQGIRHIILPQSLRRVIPSWSNEAAYLPKYTTVAYFVAVEELFAKTKLIISRVPYPFEMYLIVAIVFLVLISAVSQALDHVYDRVKIPGV